jgi:hypothetical protein
MIKIGIKTLHKGFSRPSSVKFNGSKEAKKIFYKNLDLFADPYWENLSFEDFEAMILGMGLENVSNGKRHSIDLEKFIELVKGTEITESEVVEAETTNSFDDLKKYIDKKDDIEFLEEVKGESDWSPFNTISVAQLRKMLEPVPGHFQIFHINEIKVDLMNDELIIKLK